MDWADLPELFPGIARSSGWLERLQRHAELLAAAAPVVRVSSVEAVDAVRRHYAESLDLLRIAAAVSGRNFDENLVVDVGSGGGFPGIPLAVALPGANVHLVEPLKKRARLLSEMAASLVLGNVSVHDIRAEEAGRGPLRDAAGFVTARAVAALPELLEYVAPFASPGGVIALPKGSRLEDELAEARFALAELRCDVLAVEQMRPEVSEFGQVLVLRKAGATPKPYPRRPGTPGRAPLLNRSGA